MDAPQYVHYDVASDYHSPGMFYHTLHSNTDAPQYVNFDVPWGNAPYWIFYYTLHRDMYDPQYVTPVKKKKRSNFTILKKSKKYYEMPVTNQSH